MPKFITIGYGDQEGYDRTTKTVRDAAHAHDEVLQKSGVLMGIAGFPVQVRNHEAVHVQTKDGPYHGFATPRRWFCCDRGAHYGRGYKDSIANSMRCRIWSRRGLAARTTTISN